MRALVRDLITAFRDSDRHPFPQWTDVRIPAVKDEERQPELLLGYASERQIRNFKIRWKFNRALSPLGRSPAPAGHGTYGAVKNPIEY